MMVYAKKPVASGWKWSLITALLLGCTTQSVGARCQQNSDCDTANNEVCRSENTPSASCSSSGGCICCPADPAVAATVAACARRTALDAGPRDVVVVDTGSTDTGPLDTGVVDAGAADTGPADTGATDVGKADTGTDVGTDAKSSDATSSDAGAVSDVADGG